MGNKCYNIIIVVFFQFKFLLNNLFTDNNIVIEKQYPCGMNFNALNQIFILVFLT